MPTLFTAEPVTGTQIIVAACAVITCTATVGGIVVAVSKAFSVSMTEFRLGIHSLTQALEKLAGSVDSGFIAVHNRLDACDNEDSRNDRRILRLELKNGIVPDMH